MPCPQRAVRRAKWLSTVCLQGALPGSHEKRAGNLPRHPPAILRNSFDLMEADDTLPDDEEAPPGLHHLEDYKAPGKPKNSLTVL